MRLPVARTVDENAHALRRDAFLDVAQRLLRTKGYERMSVQDVLAETGASKGAFYHYFDSKQALLAAVMTRIADAVAAGLAPVADLRDVGAQEKVNRFFAALADQKVRRRELLVALTRVWQSDDNAVVRQKLRPAIADRVAPILATIIDQGAAEGVFDVRDPRRTARLVVSLVQDLNELLADLFLAMAEGRDDWPAVERTVAAYTDALARILGVPDDAVTFVDMTVLRRWFAKGADA